jgi:geranylgeranyl diphosphate synthase type I
MTDTSREERVKQAVGQRRELVNGAIEEFLPVKRPERLYEASRYLLDAGGKRLRPASLLLVGEALTDTPPLSTDYRGFPDCEGVERDLMAAAVSIEVIQSFTLIHDDIMDDDDLRRGVPSVHRQYDDSTAILAGDTLYSKAFEIMLETDAPPQRVLDAMDVLATTCTQICEGQSLDIAFEEQAAVTVEEYMEMIELKTAVLYAASTVIPALVLGADEEIVEAMANFGVEVGKAFQIKDDLLDLTTPSEQLGKQRGSDLIEGKQTLVTIHARQQGVDVDGLLAAETPADVTEADVDEALETLREAGSIEFARSRMGTLTDDAIDRLSVLPDNDASRTLADLATYLIEREY